MVTGNLDFGISLAAADDNTLNQNQIHSNSSHGLLINGSENFITHNTIYDNGLSGSGAGVFVETGNDNTILYNSIYNNTVLGIELAPSANDSRYFRLSIRFIPGRMKLRCRE